jgi:hypothetical protein
MMMPAMITPMTSTDDPFHLLATALVGHARALAPRPRAQAQMATMAQLRVADLSLNLQGSHQPAGHSRLIQAWAQLGSWLTAVHPAGEITRSR